MSLAFPHHFSKYVSEPTLEEYIWKVSDSLFILLREPRHLFHVTLQIFIEFHPHILQNLRVQSKEVSLEELFEVAKLLFHERVLT